MAISFSDFLTQVRNFTEVDSNVLTDTIIGQFIRNVELDIAGKVDYDDTRKYATSSFSTGKRFLVTPSDFLVIRSLQVFSTTSISTGDRTFMEKRDTSFITEYNGTGATGVPKYYANWDESSIVVAPTPNADYAVQLNYIITPPSFTSSNTTYLSEYQQGMLLHGVLTEAYAFLKGPMDMLQLYEGKYKEAVQLFAAEQVGRRRRDDYTDGTVRIPIQSPPQ